MSNNPVPKGVNLEYSSFGMKQKQGQFQGVKPEESKKGSNKSRRGPGGGWDDEDDGGFNIRPKGLEPTPTFKPTANKGKEQAPDPVEKK
mmetsp:Transcript_3238/g.2786  ORF Transcript_3238/g.2786 Transcript_3238/m.2786 type:complete len:89 (-) Transcript_3238:1901-2167(-)